MNWVRHGGSTTFETKSSYCRVARQGLPCYTAVARLGFKRRATAVLKSNSIRSIEYGTAVARRLKRASKRGLITPPIRNTSWGSHFQTFFLQEIWGTFCFRLWNKMPNYFNGNEAFTLAVFNTLWTFQQFAHASVYNLQFEFELDQTFRKLTHGLKYSRSSLHTLLLPKTLFA